MYIDNKKQIDINEYIKDCNDLRLKKYKSSTDWTTTIVMWEDNDFYVNLSHFDHRGNIEIIRDKRYIFVRRWKNGRAKDTYRKKIK